MIWLGVAAAWLGVVWFTTRVFALAAKWDDESDAAYQRRLDEELAAILDADSS